MNKYDRQIILKGFGTAGQERLLQAKVLVVGAGGLGCPALQYLAAAGVGTIGIVDTDKVSETNLHRQVLYGIADIHQPKVECAKAALLRLNPDIDIQVYYLYLTVSNALEIIELYDIVIDGTDNFHTRYLLNDACVLLGKPLVYGAVSQFEGQVAVFNYSTTAGNRGVNYRDIFPSPPKNNEVQNCAEAGVLGVLPGIIGTMQANETIKILAGIGEPLADKLLTYNALTNHTFELQLSTVPETMDLIPKDKLAFWNMDYIGLCSHPISKYDIDFASFQDLLHQEDVQIIDVRNEDETPVLDSFTHLRIPLPVLHDHWTELTANTIVFFCKTGQRSKQAAKHFEMYNGDGSGKKIGTIGLYGKWDLL
jgi:sulfur-carrier protein adenylyltransferase/sulfurtransferase